MKQEILYLEQIVTAQPSGQNLEYVSLSLRAGEILGVTGISESGASVLADVLCGKLCPASGTIYLDGVPVSYRSENEARQAGNLRDYPSGFRSEWYDSSGKSGRIT